MALGAGGGDGAIVGFEVAAWEDMGGGEGGGGTDAVGEKDAVGG